MDNTKPPGNNTGDEYNSRLGPPSPQVPEQPTEAVPFVVATVEVAATDASSAIANTLEESALCLEKEGIQDITDDVTNLIRTNPIPAMLIGIAAGFLAGRPITPRS